MTNYMSHSDKGTVEYNSLLWCDAASCEGVRYQIARVSVGRRIQLARLIREIGRKLEFLEASSDVREKLEAMVLSQEIDRVYLEWGLEAIEGLSIDGEAATPLTLIELGPAELSAEILARIKSECGLNEEERKN